jgi:hypothetical protein
MGKNAKQVQAVHMFWLDGEHSPIKLFRLPQSPGLVVLESLIKQVLDWRRQTVLPILSFCYTASLAI